MALTKATYVQGAGQRFQDHLIDPDTLAAGTLFQRFDTRAFPTRGVKYTGHLGAILAASTLSKGAVGTGGTFAAGTYFWKVVALDADGGVASNEVTATLLANGTQPLSWTAVAGATSYKVYRGTVTNTEDALVNTTTGLTYTDTGTAGTAGTPPASNTTGRTVPKAARTTHGAGS